MPGIAGRQPLVTGKWGSLYRSWFWAPDASSRNKKLGKRRSAKRERAKAKKEARDVPHGTAAAEAARPGD